MNKTLQADNDIIRRSFNRVQEVKKDIRELRDKEFIIEGYPQIFTTKIDYKLLFQQWDLEVPGRITKKSKIELLTKTRDKHDECTLNYKYWDYILSSIDDKASVKTSLSLF